MKSFSSDISIKLCNIKKDDLTKDYEQYKSKSIKAINLMKIFVHSCKLVTFWKQACSDCTFYLDERKSWPSLGVFKCHLGVFKCSN